MFLGLLTQELICPSSENNFQAHTLALFSFLYVQACKPRKKASKLFWIFKLKNSSDTPIVSFSAKKRFAGWHVFVFIFHLNSEWKKCRRACLCLHLCKSTCLNLNGKNTRVFVFIYVGQSRLECRLSIRLMHAVYCKQCGKGNHRQGGDAFVEQKT